MESIFRLNPDISIIRKYITRHFQYQQIRNYLQVEFRNLYYQKMHNQSWGLFLNEIQTFWLPENAFEAWKLFLSEIQAFALSVNARPAMEIISKSNPGIRIVRKYTTSYGNYFWEKSRHLWKCIRIVCLKLMSDDQLWCLQSTMKIKSGFQAKLIKLMMCLVDFISDLTEHSFVVTR